MFKQRRQLCDEWYDKPNINPRTNRKITKSGNVYKALQKECMDEYSHAVCNEWLLNKGVNPRTKRKIKVSGAVFKMLEKECVELDHEEQSSDASWFSMRNVNKLAIHRFLTNNLNIKQWDMCMTGNKSDNFKSHFESVQEIGKGTFGQVYRVSISSKPKPLYLVIKEAYLSATEKKLILQNTSSEKLNQIPESAYPFEFKYLKLLNRILELKECPNFLYTYNIAMCQGCVVETLFRQRRPRTGYCYITFMENAYSDLSQVVLTPEQQVSVLYQLLIAVHTIHQKFALHHRDIKKHNIMIQYINVGGYFEYIINNKSYFVQNAGVVAFLGDFGGSNSYFRNLQYDFEEHMYGTRLAKVKRSRIKHENSFLIWEPIYVPGFQRITWKDNDKDVVGTVNRITENNLRKVNRLIKVEDVKKYPCFEFSNDIQDVIRIFIGGKQATQPGIHSILKELDPMLAKKLEINAYMDKVNLNMFNTHGTVKYVRADEMLEQLYEEPDELSDISIIDTFKN